MIQNSFSPLVCTHVCVCMLTGPGWNLKCKNIDSNHFHSASICPIWLEGVCIRNVTKLIHTLDFQIIFATFMDPGPADIRKKYQSWMHPIFPLRSIGTFVFWMKSIHIIQISESTAFHLQLGNILKLPYLSCSCWDCTI